MEAINLDGGGSTTLQAIYPGDTNLTTVNSPSGSSLRNCGNYILQMCIRDRLITALLYAPGTLIYIWGNRQRGEKSFQTPLDFIVLAVLLIMFAASAVLIGNGTIKPF